MKIFLLKAAAVFVAPTLLAVLAALVLYNIPPVAGHEIHLAPLAEMPQYVREARPETQHAYRFAAANHDLLTHFPCYCGCVYLGHEHNLDCYLQNVATDGTMIFDSHAAGCGICVEITNDVARLWGEGEALEVIQEFIVATYSHRGPST